MRTVLAVPIDGKVLPQIAERVAAQQSKLGGQWVSESELYIHLAELDPLPSLDEDSPLARALRKASNAHQGFRIRVGGLRFDGDEAYIPVIQKAGMLQSVAFSVAGRLPDASGLHFDDPWKPKLTVARFPRAPKEPDRLRLEADWVAAAWDLPVKSIQLLNVDGAAVSTLFADKLPAAGA